MKAEKAGLKEFCIEGLFGSLNIAIPFESRIKILVGENGLGKTTMLNALYYLITSQFQKLNLIDFKRMSLTLSSGEIYEIQKTDLTFVTDEDFYDPRIINLTNVLEKSLSDIDRLEIAEAFKSQNNKIISQVLDKYSRKIFDIYPGPSYKIRRAIQFMFEGSLAKLQELSARLRQNLGTDIIYFPTYRRIEEDLKSLGLGFDNERALKEDQQLIQFGMEDVQKVLDGNLLDIKNTTITGFSSLTGEILNHYIEGMPPITKTIKKKIAPNILRIILDRVGESIKNTSKDEIMRLVTSGDIFANQERYGYLVNFLVQLTNIYEKQRELDNLLKEFSDVCSKYLIGKKVIYNESKLTISVIDDIKEKPIALKNLSSGEKQILSIFSKIFLESRNNKIVLFDEPELSLSIEWQKELLPDIIKSQKCDLLICVTHSPFIFDNDLDQLAFDMNKYVRQYVEN